MGTSDGLNPKSFEDLLALFSTDREEAGEKYEQIRNGLVSFFYFRGCTDGETLADETINRVASKIDVYDPARGERLASYFYGFARKVLLEHHRSTKRESQLGDADIVIAEALVPADGNDNRSDCLAQCLEKLSPDEREIIIEYYGHEKLKKVEVRRKLCEKFAYSAGALHTKIFRIKADLRNCVESCLRPL